MQHGRNIFFKKWLGYLTNQADICFCREHSLTSQKVSLFGWPAVWLVRIQLLCLCLINNILTCLAKFKPVKQEVSRTVILPLSKQVSVLWFMDALTFSVTSTYGRFLKVLGKKSSYKSSQHIRKLFGLFLCTNFYSYFLARFGKFGLLVYSNIRSHWFR